MAGLKNILIRVIVFLAGIMFLVIGIMDNVKTKDYVKTTGTVSGFVVTGYDEDNNAEYDTKVKYTVDGTEYEELIGEYSAGNKEGSEIKIKYDPENPSEVCGDSIMSNYIYIGFGALLTIVGIFVTIKYFMTGR